MLGPVFNAAHSQPTISGGLFPILVGSSVLIYVWVRFFRTADGNSKPPMDKMLGITLIGCIMIGLGIWECYRALNI
jgi:hypothetical protein